MGGIEPDSPWRHLPCLQCRQRGDRVEGSGHSGGKDRGHLDGDDLWQGWGTNALRLRDAMTSVHQVVFTENARDHLLNQAPEWADYIRVIPPSVNTDIFSPDGPSRDVRHPLCLLAGGIRPVKRSACAIDLVDQLRRATGHDFHLAIAGPVRDREEWEKIQAKVSLRRWVHLLGEVPDDEIPIWYRSADVVLNTSQVEGVSNALMEAMSCGALVLATNIAGNRYLVTDQKTGLLFASPTEMVEKLLPVLEHPELMDHIRREARKAILRRHSLKAESEAYLAVYEQVQKRRGATADG